MTRIPLLIALAAALVGCGSSSPEAAAPTPPAQQEKLNALQQKLKGMTPEQQAQYYKDHPEEFRELSGASAWTQPKTGTPTR
jgi:hypothetical protein